MKKNKVMWITLAICFLLAAAAVTAYYLTRETEEGRIRRRIVEAAALWDKTSAEKQLSGVWKTQAVKSYFCDQVRLDFRIPMFDGAYSSEAVGANYFRARSMFRDSKLKLSDFFIHVTGPASAEAEFSAQLSGKLMTGQTVDEFRVLECVMKKIDGKWKFSSIIFREVLEK